MSDPDGRPRVHARMKRILLWAARHFRPCDGFHGGPIQVRVSFGPPGSDSAVVVPEAGADGLAAPSGVRTQAPGEAPEPGPTAPELLRHFLSDDEKAVLRELAARAPCQATEVQRAVAAGGRVARSNFWPVWKQLQVRGLIAEGAGGFRPGPPWLAALLGLLAAMEAAIGLAVTMRELAP